MKVIARNSQIIDVEADTLIVYLFENNRDFGESIISVNDALNGYITELVERDEFSGKAEQALVLHPQDTLTAKRVVLVGLGALDDFTVDT